MVRIRRSSTPSARSSRARNGALVSTTLPESISFPTTISPAVRSDAAMRSSHRDGVLAEVAGAYAHVDHRRLAGAERALESRPQVRGLLHPLTMPAERLDHLVVTRRRELAGRRTIRAVELHLPA